MKLIYQGVSLLGMLCVLLTSQLNAQEISTVVFDDLTPDHRIKGIYSIEIDETGNYLKEMSDGTLSTATLDASDQHFYFWIIENLVTRTFQLHSASTSRAVVSIQEDGTARLSSDFEEETTQLLMRMDPLGPLRSLSEERESVMAIGSIVTQSLNDYTGTAECECYGFTLDGSNRLNIHQATLGAGGYMGFPISKTELESTGTMVLQGDEATLVSVEGGAKPLNFVSSQFYVSGFGADDFELQLEPGAVGSVGFINYTNQLFEVDVYQYAKPEVGIRFDEDDVYLFLFTGDQELPSTTEIIDNEKLTGFNMIDPIYFGFQSQYQFVASQGDKTVTLNTGVPAEQYLNQSVTQRARLLVGLEEGEVSLAYTMANGLINSSNDQGSISGKHLASTNPYLPYNKGEKLVNTFDWQQSQWMVRYDGGLAEGEAEFSPFYNNTNAGFSGISAKFDPDDGSYMGGEDFSSIEGWELLKANLGYYADGTEINPAPKFPYVLLYDRISATLRVFVYVHSEGASNQLQVTLGVGGKNPIEQTEEDYTPLLWGSLQQYKSLDQVEYGSYTKSTALSASTSEGREWYYYDFIMEFDPCTSFFESSIIVDVNKMLVGEMSLVGRMQGGTIPAGSEEYSDWMSNQENYLMGVMGTPFGELSNTLGDISMNQMSNFGLKEFEESLEGTLVGSDIPEWEKQEAKLLWEAQELVADQEETEREEAKEKQLWEGIIGVSSVVTGGIAGGVVEKLPIGGAITGLNTLGNGILNIVQGASKDDESVLPSSKLAYAKKLHYENIKDKVKNDDQVIKLPIPEPRPNVVFGELALSGTLEVETHMTTAYLATPGALNSDQGPEWHQNGSRGAAPLYNNPLGKFTMLNQPEFAIAVSKSGDNFSAYLKIKEKPYFAINDRVGGKIVDAIKLSINVETASDGPLPQNKTSSGYTILFDGENGSLPGEMDITHLLHQDSLRAKFANASEGTNFNEELSKWITVSYDVWSLTLTSLKSRSQERIMANSSQYYDGVSTFEFQELEGNLSEFTLAAQNKAFCDGIEAFNTYNFGDRDGLGQNYTISNIQDNFKSVMYNYCTEMNNGNAPDTLANPYLKHLGDRMINELEELNFDVKIRNDEDLDETQTLIFALDAVSIASGMTIDPSTGSYSWSTTESHDGTHEVTISVTDNEGRDDKERFTIVVNEVNTAPVLTAIGDQVIDELTELTFTVYAEDPDDTNQELSFTLDETSIASGMSLDVSSGEFSWTPTESQDGTYEVTVSVSDGTATDTEVISIEVAEVNSAPILSTLVDQSVDELTELTLSVTAEDTDIPEQTLTYSLDEESLSLGMSLNESTGAFSWTPSESQDGSYNVTLTVSDGSAIDSETFTVMVAEQNTAPVLVVIDDQNVDELTELTFTVTAEDTDIPEQTLTYSLDEESLGLGMSINESTGAFSWTPTEAQDGSYDVTVSVSDGSAIDSETYTITVVEQNTSPDLTTIGDQSVDELTDLTFTVTAEDTDIPEQNLTYSLDEESLGLGMSIHESTGAFSWTPTEAQDGSYEVTVSVSDGTATDTEVISIEVAEVNSAPILSTLVDQSVDELTELTLSVTAEDTDIPEQTLTYSLDVESLSLGMSLNESTGAFSWTPSESQDGSYNVTLTVSDGSAMDSETFTVMVAEQNTAPVLVVIDDQNVDELTELTFTVTAEDTDIPEQTLTYSLDEESLGIGMSINESTGAFSWTPSESQDGSYEVTLTVSDGSAIDSETFTVMVAEQNTAPVLVVIDDQNVDELTELTFTVTAEDTDIPEQTLTYSLDEESLGLGMSINESTGAFSWIPTEVQDGEQTVSITVSDGVLTDSQSITITVNEVEETVNAAPVLAAIDNQSVDEGTELTFTANATDVDSESLSFTLDEVSMSKGMSIDASTGEFSWTPSESQDGEHTVSITVSDGKLTDSQSITIMVNEVEETVNEAPVLDPVSDQSVDEGVELSFNVSATDTDSESLTFSLDETSVNKGMNLDAITGAFNWTPSESQDGQHTVSLTVSDGELEDSQDFVITVNEVEETVNEAPVLDPVSDQSVDEGVELSFNVSATDTDSESLTFSLDETSISKGMTIEASSGTFSWTPTESQDGLHEVTLSVTDGIIIVNAIISIEVLEVNQAPVLSEISDHTIRALEELTFTTIASDDDEPIQTLTFTLDETSESKGMFVDASSGLFSWTPTESQIGVFAVTLSVTDGELKDSQTFEVFVDDIITAADLGNLNEVSIYPIPAKDRLSIKVEGYENSDDALIQLISVGGLRVFQANVDMSTSQPLTVTINLSDIQSGVYIIRISAEGYPDHLGRIIIE
ncbi:putative Ig domain-containing protein [Reichenbachiella ulvae]|uniref:Ig domain-containing protein n=1 Tax=Reichenbachiella ulvae TaxID=2980104 RepID=A0ABT3CQH7_9BACT|nr:putative Ig domain-containing protein [Reichenbachiella ulvae]MCV9385968.1 putative Ig domain-containing protein [Reichenbachiella ulvae]